MTSGDGRRWTSDTQQNWLESELPNFQNAKANHTYHKFWPPLFEQWFKSFPEPLPPVEDYYESVSESEVENAPPSDNDDRIRALTLKRAGAKACQAPKKKRRKVNYLISLSHEHAAQIYLSDLPAHAGIQLIVVRQR